jgi:hypothetical protein
MPNPNPSPETRFQPGQSGNPGGLSSETARLIRENAESAARIRARLLQATEDSLKERDTDTAMELIESAMLKMLKDSEDRGLGAPGAVNGSHDQRKRHANANPDPRSR